MNLATQRLCWKMLECSNWQQLKWVNTLNGAYPLQTCYRGIVFFGPSWLWSTRVIVILNSQSGMHKLPQPQRSHVLHAKCSTAKPSNAVTLQQGRQIVLISLDWAFKKMSSKVYKSNFPTPLFYFWGLFCCTLFQNADFIWIIYTCPVLITAQGHISRGIHLRVKATLLNYNTVIKNNATLHFYSTTSISQL